MKTRIFAYILCTLAAVPAHAMDRNDAIAKCATAVDDHLRDPATAEYHYSQSLATSASPDSWSVLLPVRAQNAYGAYSTATFGCLIKGGHVVQVIRAGRG